MDGRLRLLETKGIMVIRTNMVCNKCQNEYVDDGKQSKMCPECRSAQGRRSKRKGSANELRFAKKLQEQFDKHGLKYKVRRTPRSGSIHEFEPSDLLWSNLPNDSVFKRHFELKNSNSWSIEDWFEKAKQIETEQGTNRQPTLVIRKPNSQQSYVVVDEDDYIKMLVELEILKHE